MKVIDLTQTIREDMQVFPGTEQPRLKSANTIEKDGFRETLITMYSHTGTHMDAPAHMLKGAAELDKLDAATFLGKAAVIPCMGKITMDEINACREIADKADFLLFATGQDALWGKDEYYNAPVPHIDVIRYAAETGKKGVGIDCISVDPIEGEMPNHMVLFNAGMVIVENLKNLTEIAGKLVTFAALPLKYACSDGAPVRAIAILED